MRNWLLIGCGIGIEAGLLGLVVLGNLTLNAGEYVVVFVAISLLYWLACFLVLKKHASVMLKTCTQGQYQKPEQTTLLIIVFMAALFRLTLVWVAPSLSTDQFRYTWEAHLITQGVSPYRYAPNDPVLLPLHDNVWSLVQQKETASPYPPLSQLISVLTYLVWGENLLGPKFAAAFFDILTCILLIWLLGLCKLDPRRVVLYAWCPLPVLEFALSGHNDAPMLSLLILAIGLTLEKKPRWTSVVLGLACLVKFTPLFVLPVFLVAWTTPKEGWRTFLRWQSWRYAVVTLGIIGAGYLPFVILGHGAVGSLLEYAGSWRDNDALLFGVLADRITLVVAKVVTIGLLLAIIVLLTLHPHVQNFLSLPRQIMLVFGATLLIASTVHPWYFSWILVLLPLIYGRDANWRLWDNAWLFFAVAVELVYLTYAGDGRAYIWLTPLEFLPLYVAGGYSTLRFYRFYQKLTKMTPAITQE